ncbi:PP2C family protein-serine/threonine phosphatase [Streptomyces sp. NPDC054802]
MQGRSCLGDSLPRPTASVRTERTVAPTGAGQEGLPVSGHVIRGQGLAPQQPLLQAESADPLARVLRGAGPLLLDAQDLRSGDGSRFHAAQTEVFERLGARSVVMAPLRARRQVLGALTLARDPEQEPLTDDDAALVEDLADRIALAVDNNRLHAKVQHVAEHLRRSLLPPLPADLPVATAARYVAAPSEAQVGGDWHDCFPLPKGAIALVIGDVSGHDIPAAVAMSRLRNMLRSLA